MRTQHKDSFFNIWKSRINVYVEKKLGVKLDDLPDEMYRVWFDETDITPKEASEIIVKHNTYYM